MKVGNAAPRFADSEGVGAPFYTISGCGKNEVHGDLHRQYPSLKIA